MCQPVCHESKAHETLARLMERELAYSYGYIDPVALRLFIRSRWDQITKLAHAIHADE